MLNNFILIIIIIEIFNVIRMLKINIIADKSQLDVCLKRNCKPNENSTEVNQNKNCKFLIHPIDPYERK